MTQGIVVEKMRWRARGGGESEGGSCLSSVIKIGFPKSKKRAHLLPLELGPLILRLGLVRNFFDAFCLLSWTKAQADIGIRLLMYLPLGLKISTFGKLPGIGDLSFVLT